MKKLLIGLFMVLVIGCSKNVKLDLEDVRSNIDNTGLFEGTQVDLNYLTSKYGLVKDGIEEYTINMSNMLDNASMYAIFKVSDIKTAKKNTDDFIEKYCSSWMMGYNLEQEAIVEDKMEEVYGSYIIYVISTDNDKVMDIIKE